MSDQDDKYSDEVREERAWKKRNEMRCEGGFWFFRDTDSVRPPPEEGSETEDQR